MSSILVARYWKYTSHALASAAIKLPRSCQQSRRRYKQSADAIDAAFDDDADGYLAELRERVRAFYAGHTFVL